jgi:hypothetical protein
VAVSRWSVEWKGKAHHKSEVCCRSHRRRTRRSERAAPHHCAQHKARIALQHVNRSPQGSTRRGGEQGTNLVLRGTMPGSVKAQRNSG